MEGNSLGYTLALFSLFDAVFLASFAVKLRGFYGFIGLVWCLSGNLFLDLVEKTVQDCMHAYFGFDGAGLVNSSSFG